MANLKIDGLKGSEVLQIKAAVVKVMEDAANFSATNDPDLTEEGGNYKMSFRKGRTSLEELEKIQSSLGKNFKINLAAASKDDITITLAASKNDFTHLIGKQPEQPEKKNGQTGLDFGGQGGGDNGQHQ